MKVSFSWLTLFMLTVVSCISMPVPMQSASATQPQAVSATAPGAPTIPPPPTNTPLPISTPSVTPTIVLESSPVVESTVTPSLAAPYFEIDGAPFRFIGGFVPGWHWGDEWWTEATDEDLVKTAKNSGISVLHLMLPQFERQLGTYTESELRKLDHLLDASSRYGVYVMISFIHAYGIVLAPDDPYFHPRGIEGLLTDEEIMQGFKNRIEILITRRNTFNGKVYREDPTILAWLVVDEPISAPWNYPEGPPNVTATQLQTWLGETASYIKSLDPNHLVAVNTTAAIDNLGDDWIKAFDTPSLDFIEAEDADMRILNYFYPTAANDYSLRFHSLKKPVVAMLSFTSGEWDQAKICNDYTWQAEMLSQALTRHFETGTSGVVVFRWGSTLYPFLPPFDRCFNYNATNTAVVQALREVASEWNLLDYPFIPLGFVKIRK